MKAKAKRTSTAPWSGTVVTVRGAARVPVIESAKEAETALELAPGERGSLLVGRAIGYSNVCSNNCTSCFVFKHQ